VVEVDKALFAKAKEEGRKEEVKEVSMLAMYRGEGGE